MGNDTPDVALEEARSTNWTGLDVVRRAPDLDGFLRVRDDEGRLRPVEWAIFAGEHDDTYPTMVFGVGPERGFLRWYGDRDDMQVPAGTEYRDGGTSYWRGWQEQVCNPGEEIPVGTVLEAAAQFVATGIRPTCVEWMPEAEVPDLRTPGGARRRQDRDPQLQSFLAGVELPAEFAEVRATSVVDIAGREARRTVRLLVAASHGADKGRAWRLVHGDDLTAPYLVVGLRGQQAAVVWVEPGGGNFLPADGVGDEPKLFGTHDSYRVLPAGAELPWDTVLDIVEEFTATGDRPACVEWKTTDEPAPLVPRSIGTTVFLSYAGRYDHADLVNRLFDVTASGNAGRVWFLRHGEDDPKQPYLVFGVGDGVGAVEWVEPDGRRLVPQDGTNDTRMVFHTADGGRHIVPELAVRDLDGALAVAAEYLRTGQRPTGARWRSGQDIAHGPVTGLPQESLEAMDAMTGMLAEQTEIDVSDLGSPTELMTMLMAANMRLVNDTGRIWFLSHRRDSSRLAIGLRGEFGALEWTRAGESTPKVPADGLNTKPVRYYTVVLAPHWLAPGAEIPVDRAVEIAGRFVDSGDLSTAQLWTSVPQHVGSGGPLGE
ncbi:Imm1 family immunity protein [Saccharothrix sp. Mg75]|uniref:Imm1 family immunity protein n=1 Tax=Saccharothrix sp. Mg75 TaxID=3445357 RepID=UPI003EE9B83C